MGCSLDTCRLQAFFPRPFNEAASKKRQMLPGGSKQMSSLQAGYFDPQFTRIFEGEGYVSMNQVRRQYMMAESKKNLSKAFIPSSGEKKPYANITIGKQLSHSADLYDAAKLNFKKDNEEHHRLLKGSPFKLNLHPKDYFDNNPYLLETALPPLRREEKKEPPIKAFKPPSPGKKPGGMKAGTFESYPVHSADPYVVKMGQMVPGKGEKVFHPPNGPKSRPIESIMALNVKSLGYSPQILSLEIAHLKFQGVPLVFYAPSVVFQKHLGFREPTDAVLKLGVL
ncbi:hypothetical protein A6R68_06743 [Neotoma lepida]|uniref:Cilia-and flagella-associated protein 96 n=1 Tax=Neotoma lepida TaxID=56216 RepID=A0A1A6GEP4_NEOLE|nr:hypothetical protein A6R68_06743 [Neotoma lepida]